MKLTKCENGHFYDAEKYPVCPYCNTELQQAGSRGIVAQGDKQPKAATGRPNGPVTGWLVVMEGPAMGRDLRLGEGCTYLGVDENGDPCTLSTDAPLSLRQAVVVYDPEDGSFNIAPGTAQEMARLDGKAVMAPTPLKMESKLVLADVRLQFVAFCGSFRWKKPEEKKSAKAR